VLRWLNYKSSEFDLRAGCDEMKKAMLEMKINAINELKTFTQLILTGCSIHGINAQNDQRLEQRR
jgi:hypothetical protein